ncbi:MAG: hypothetical protein H6Q89_1450 [Myxococcaceae bacterium]|nr:hypothetical protein [Myxococcaceae bacterium]
MEVRCFHLLREAAPHRRHLDALSRASRLKDPFSTFSFLENFSRHDGYYPNDKNAEPWFLVAFENNQPIAYLPLRRIPDRILGLESGKLEFFATHDTNCPYLVCRPEDEARCGEAFLRYLLSRSGEWAWLDFHQQLEGSALFPHPPRVDLGRYEVRAWPTRESNVIDVRWSSLQQYFQALRGKFRTDLRKKFQTLLAAGEVSYVWSMDPKVTPVLFELMRPLERRTWRAGNRFAIDSHPDRVEYFRSLLAPRQPMRAHLGLLLLDRTPIAASFSGEYEKTLQLMAIMYDEAFERLGPGAAVVLMTMRHAIESGYRAVNFLSGFSYYKKRWLAESAPTVSGQLIRKRSLRHLRLKLGDLKRRLRPGEAEDELTWNPAHREAKLAARKASGEPDPEWIAALLAQLDAHARWLRHADLAALLEGTLAAQQKTKPERPRPSAGGLSRTAPPTPGRPGLPR